MAATIILILFPLPAIGATAFLWRIYISDTRRPRSWLLFRDAVGMTILTLGASGVALVGFGSIAFGPLPSWVVLFLVFSILMTEVVPVYFAITYWRVRHGLAKQPTVPVPSTLPRDHHRSGD